MAAIVVNVNVKVKLGELEYPNKEVATLIQKLLDHAVHDDPILGDSVHEEILDELINVEVTADE